MENLQLNNDLLNRLTKWKKDRLAAMFEIPVKDSLECLDLKRALRELGFNAHGIWYGKDIVVTLFLTDNK